MKILLIRYGAFGDLLYCLPLVDRLLADGHELHLHTGLKGLQIFAYDSRFKTRWFMEPGTQEHIDSTWERMERELCPDRVICLSNTIEDGAIPMRGSPGFDLPVHVRRKLVGNRSFYNLPLTLGGYDTNLGDPPNVGTVAFLESEIAHVERWRESHEKDFVVLMALSGSTCQKRFPRAEIFANRICDTIPEAVVYLAGDASVQGKVFKREDGRIRTTLGAPFRQLLLMARYADYVVGPETGLLVAAGMWGTPKTMLCTTSSLVQAVHGHRNDFSLQAHRPCSPCLRAIYQLEDCYDHRFSVKYAEPMTPCCFNFSDKEVTRVARMVQRNMRYLREDDAYLRTPPVRVSGLHLDLSGLPGGCVDLQRVVHGEVQVLRERTADEGADGGPVGADEPVPERA